MSLTSRIGNEEISANPATGLVLGDVDPMLTQDGAVTRFRDADVENADDLATNKAAFDPHDHGAAGGGQKIGTGPVVAIETNGIDTAALGSSSITNAAVQTGAVTTPKIADDTVEKAQLGSPKSKSKSATGTGSTNFTFGDVSVLPLFSIDADPGVGVAISCAPYKVKVNSSSSITVSYVYGGLNVTLTCRAWGTTGIS